MGKVAWMASLGERGCDAVTVKTFAELGRSFCHLSIKEMRTGSLTLPVYNIFLISACFFWCFDMEWDCYP